MKKLISLILVPVLLLLCSCGAEEAPAVKTSADMLSITDNESTYLGCVSRFKAVSEPLCAVVNILESQNNEAIKQQDENGYFLNEKYIPTSFEPFAFSRMPLTGQFDDNMNNELAQNEYKVESGGRNILFERQGDNCSLKFVSEELTEKITAEYDKENDSFRYMCVKEENGVESVEEFAEFYKTADGVYLIQTDKVRACISFDEQNRVKSFCCSELKNGSYSPEDGIYPSSEITAVTAEGWAISPDSSRYVSIHTYKDNILTHGDSSGGQWKKVEINALGYASALYYN